jgi:hypothetical protein
MFAIPLSTPSILWNVRDLLKRFGATWTARVVDVMCMTRPRNDSTSPNREPVPPPTKPEDSHETEDDRIVFSSWDAPLVPSKA